MQKRYRVFLCRDPRQFKLEYWSQFQFSQTNFRNQKRERNVLYIQMQQILIINKQMEELVLFGFLC